MQNSVTVPCYKSSWQGYTFTISANLTGNILGPQREIVVSFSVEAFSSGGYSSFTDPMAYICVGGDRKAQVQVNSIAKNATTTLLSWTGFVDSNQTINIKGEYIYSGGTDFLPPKGVTNVSVDLSIPALTSELTLPDEFILEEENSITINKYSQTYNHKLEIKLGDAPLKTIENYTSQTISLSNKEILTAYKSLDNAKTLELTFLLTTLNNNELVGVSKKKITAKAKGSGLIKANDEYKRGIVWIKDYGEWKRGLALVKNGYWKRGV